MISLRVTQPRHCRGYCLLDIRTVVGFVKGVETMLSSTALISLHYEIGQNKKWEIDGSITGRRTDELAFQRVCE